MKAKIYIFIYGTVLSGIIALLAFYYLNYIKNKANPYTESALVQVLETFDHRFNDIKYKFADSRKTEAPIALLAVDDESIQEIGRWPWGRDIHSMIIEKLIDYNISAIGLDIIHSEPERYMTENDLQLARLIENHSDKIVLGAFSEHQINLQAHQDYCINEAFLYTGGDQIVKLNTTLIVDDTSESLDDLNWRGLFGSIFKLIQSKTELEYLTILKKDSASDLSTFQKNYLRSKKEKDIFDYCSTWLTADDEIFREYQGQLAQIYHDFFSEKEKYQGLSLDEQLKKFKTDSQSFPVPQYGKWQDNIDSIQQASQYTGSFIAKLDEDGYVRRYPLFYRSGNKLGSSFVPSLSLQTYLISKGYRADVKIVQEGQRKRIESFKIIDPTGDEEKVLYELPVDEFGQLIINYYGPSHTLPYVSAKDLFSNDNKISVKQRDGVDKYGQIMLRERRVAKEDFFKNRALIFGVTSTALYDIRNTPVEANFPGPEIHLTVLANLLDQSFIHILENEHIILPLALLAMGMILSAILAAIGAIYSLLCLVLTLILFFALDYYLFTELNYLVSSFFFFIQIVILHFAVFGIKYFSEELKKNEIKKTFSKYVSPQVVNELLQNDKNLELGGQKREMTAFFSDVRNFTTFSEKMDPQDLSDFLNSYLTPMTDMVFKNNGTLDKYMGDGMMAFFGAPISMEDHAYHACQCALASIEKLDEIRIEFAAKGWPEVNIGIGINSGMMSVGNMGSKIVQSYTILGDAVNLASRLEGATKDYGITILAGEKTYELAKDRMIFREVDRVRVKGKQLPVRAYHLVAEHMNSDLEEWLEKYQQAYKIYHQRNFKKAHENFSLLSKKYPDDKVLTMYIQRSAHFIENPPDSDWDGVYERKTK